MEFDYVAKFEPFNVNIIDYAGARYTLTVIISKVPQYFVAHLVRRTSDAK